MPSEFPLPTRDLRNLAALALRLRRHARAPAGAVIRVTIRDTASGHARVGIEALAGDGPPVLLRDFAIQGDVPDQHPTEDDRYD